MGPRICFEELKFSTFPYRETSNQFDTLLEVGICPSAGAARGVFNRTLPGLNSRETCVQRFFRRLLSPAQAAALPSADRVGSQQAVGALSRDLEQPVEILRLVGCTHKYASSTSINNKASLLELAQRARDERCDTFHHPEPVELLLIYLHRGKSVLVLQLLSRNIPSLNATVPRNPSCGPPGGSARIPASLQALHNRLWVASYGSHGLELLYTFLSDTCTPSPQRGYFEKPGGLKLICLKVVGDPNVPSGRYTFSAKLDEAEVLAASGRYVCPPEFGRIQLNADPYSWGAQTWDRCTLVFPANSGESLLLSWNRTDIRFLSFEGAL
ncbi:hypothetical protein CYMTET_18507 [Cymbomonas tetramitiformis]|uniref:Uncharacterized protein n=1 Tax=Cymbomonas tetramitiformis TaxID=36881 RepID=A0AAE0G8D8_9CHLO|nr:hypothetical protein CYMTET_18507 [Cymbomonas tetramitiformis]